MLLITIAPSAATSGAEAVPRGGTPLVGELSSFRLAGPRASLGNLRPAAVDGFEQAVRIETRDGAGSEWDVQITAPTITAVEAGDVILARFRVRCVDSMTGEGHVGFVFELAGPPHDKSAEVRLGAASQWQECFVPFTAGADYAPGSAQVCFRVGYDRQVIELADVQVLNYGKSVKLEDLPRTRMSYSGRSPDAPWRVEALERIERIRKGDLVVKVVDSAGRPIPDASVQVEMRRHAFGFGSCVTAEHLTGDSPDAARYREIVEKYFNRVVFENDMKWPAMWDGIPPRLDAAVDWLLERKIQIRGHNLHWPSWRWSPTQLRALENDPAALRERCAERVTSAVSHFRGKLIHWDVVNEPYNNVDLLNILGQDVMVQWFRLARSADPQCKLYLNDFGIFDGGAGNEHRAHFFKTIRWLQERGAPIDGIGIQSHFSAALPAPTQLLGVLDQFSSLGLPIESTELSLNIADRQLQADYLRDYMIALFSHPKVEGVMLWGFWQGRHWRPEAGLWAEDWSIRPAGQVWLDLVHRQWKTRASLMTDQAGVARVRGFAGEYEITVNAGDQTKTVPASLPVEGATITVQFP